MRFHVFKRNLKNLWRYKAIRIAALAIVILATIRIQQFAANRPEPVELTSNKVAIPDVFFGEKVLVATESGDNQVQLVHAGKLTEEVDAHFSKARLGPTTLSDYEDQHPPISAEVIHCSPINWLEQNAIQPAKTGKTQSTITTKPCSTSIALSPVAKHQESIELALFQTDTNGRDKYRHLVAEVRNTEAAVKLKLVPRLTMPLPGSSERREEEARQVIDCGRYLTVGTWQQRIGGATEIHTVMDAGSTLRTRFSAQGLWSGVDGYFEPFSFRSQFPGNSTSSNPLKAREVKIQSFDGTKTPFSAKSADDSLIIFDSLRVGSDRLQVKLAGTAFVTVNGKLVTTSLWERFQKYPLIAAVLAAANLAILAWCLKVLKGLFS